MKQEQEIFAQAMAQPSGAAREEFLLGACGPNRELRRRVDQLLAAFHEARELDFLKSGQRSQEIPTVGADPPCHEGPGTLIGRYKLLQVIGEGGMGVVYLAEQEEPVRRRVALKVIKRGMDTRAVIARFEAERQALALMDHPHIARVLDGGATETGRPYFVMELVEGVPITEFCDQNTLPTQERLKLFAHVCQAIQSAHQKGIIHRDIKPSNVLVTLHHGEPMPKVIDFGIAKATHQKLTEKTLFTQYATMIGTPAYMSPEQAEMSSKDVDTRTDVYALGVLLYELLTGTTPFPEKRLRSLGYGEMQRVIMEEEPERPSTRLSTMAKEQKTATARNHGEAWVALSKLFKGDLDWIVMKCLEKDRGRRYETANGLARDIQRHLQNEPVTARPPSAAYQLQKAWKRNKVVFTAGALTAVALAIGMGASVWQATVATAARNDADGARLKEREQRLAAQAAQDKAEEERNRAETHKRENRLRAYTAEISAAFHALEENNLGRAIELRDHWWPKAGENDLRGFEWRLLWQLCQSDATDSLPEGAGSIKFSPDGKWLACYSGERIVIRAWPSRKVVKEIPFGEAFSPDSQLFAGAQDGKLKVWNTETWQEVKTVGTPEVRSPVVFSPRGNWLVTGAEPKGYQVWNTETWEAGQPFGDELLRRWVEHWSVAFSPDGTLLVTPGHPDGRESGNQFQVWDFPSLKARGNFEPFPGRLSSAAFAPDGKHLLTGTGEGLLLVWDVTSGRIVKRIKAHTGWFWSIGTARDISAFATASADRTVVLWDGTTYEPLVRLRGHVAAIGSVAMSPDGGTLVSGSGDGTMKFWDTKTRHVQPELQDCLYAVGFSAESRRLVGAGYRKARVWNLEDGTKTALPVQNYDQVLEPRAYKEITSTSRDVAGAEPLAAFGLTDGVVEIWDTAAIKRLVSWRIGDGDVRTVAFGPDGELIATGDDNGDVKLWETKTQRQVKRFDPLPAALRCLTFSPDGRLLAGACIDASLGLWDVSTSM